MDKSGTSLGFDAPFQSYPHGHHSEILSSPLCHAFRLNYLHRYRTQHRAWIPHAVVNRPVGQRELQRHHAVWHPNR